MYDSEFSFVIIGLIHEMLAIDPCARPSADELHSKFVDYYRKAMDRLSTRFPLCFHYEGRELYPRGEYRR